MSTRQTLPGSEFLFRLPKFTRNMLWLRSDTEMKEVAALLVKEAEEGVGTDSLGIRAANLAIKACATAGRIP